MCSCKGSRKARKNEHQRRLTAPSEVTQARPKHPLHFGAGCNRHRKPIQHTVSAAQPPPASSMQQHQNNAQPHSEDDATKYRSVRTQSPTQKQRAPNRTVWIRNHETTCMVQTGLPERNKIVPSRHSSSLGLRRSSSVSLPSLPVSAKRCSRFRQACL